MQMRIDKLLSVLGIATRQESKRLLRAAQVQVNGQIVKDGGYKCDPDRDHICVEGREIVYQEFQYFMLYKPAGCITATEDKQHKTVMDYLPKERHRNLSPVGRLDKDTEGLLLITDDGALNHDLLAPGKHVEKTYFARIDGRVTEDTIRQFKEGMDIGEEKPLAPAGLEILDVNKIGWEDDENPASAHSDHQESAHWQSEILVTITEGKYHQVRRMFQVAGMRVLYLKRIRMGTLSLDDTLKPGECRVLTAQEVSDLKNIHAERPKTAQKQMLADKKAVIFDLDGTLTDSMWVWNEIDRDFFASRNMPFPESFDKEIEGLSFTETAQYFVKTYQLEESVEELKATWNQMALEKYRTKTPLKPGALELLHYLKEHGIRTGIATSNSSLLVETFLEARGLTEYIDAITTSCEVNKGKPAPDVYLATAAKLDVKPEDCLVFEDIPMGILAGRNAGMTVCGVEDIYSAASRDEKKELADFYIEDFREILR